jgi:L-amino acid N-acyltransferase YncA
MRELEAAETAAFRDLYSVPPGRVRELPSGAVCLSVPGDGVRWVNRVAGLGVERPATEEDLDAIAAFYDGAPHSVAASPAADPADLPRRLRERGYRPGYAWMKFARGVDPLQAQPTALTVRETSDGAAFSGVVAAAYGFPDEMSAMAAGVPGRDGWRCFLAYDGDEPVGAGALFVAGEAGWLGFAGTVPTARGRGAQNAVLRARIAAAAQAGCRVLTTETGVLQEGRPASSYRNILRSGFTEAGVRPNLDSP